MIKLKQTLTILVLATTLASCGGMNTSSSNNSIGNLSVYTWQTGPWSECPTTPCGSTATQTRSVQCVDPSSVVVNNSFCTTTKPATQTSCFTPACQVTYAWQAGPWSACPTTPCGSTATQTRSVQCVSSTGQVVSQNNCSGPEPTTTTTCATPACPATYSWQTGAWSACPTTPCGSTATQTRIVQCVSSTGQVVSQNNCSGPEPTTTTTCQTPACPTTYSWHTGTWSACPTTPCGSTATQTRSVQCEDSSGNVVSNFNCSPPKPSATTTCQTPACPAGYIWKVGTWSACPTTPCGSTATQTRSVQCQDGNGNVVADSNCGQPPPARTTTCTTPACGYAGCDAGTLSDKLGSSQFKRQCSGIITYGNISAPTYNGPMQNLADVLAIPNLAQGPWPDFTSGINLAIHVARGFYTSLEVIPTNQGSMGLIADKLKGDSGIISLSTKPGAFLATNPNVICTQALGEKNNLKFSTQAGESCKVQVGQIYYINFATIQDYNANESSRVCSDNFKNPCVSYTTIFGN